MIPGTPVDTPSSLGSRSDPVAPSHSTFPSWPPRQRRPSQQRRSTQDPPGHSLPEWPLHVAGDGPFMLWPTKLDSMTVSNLTAVEILQSWTEHVAASGRLTQEVAEKDALVCSYRRQMTGLYDLVTAYRTRVLQLEAAVSAKISCQQIRHDMGPDGVTEYHTRDSCPYPAVDDVIQLDKDTMTSPVSWSDATQPHDASRLDHSETLYFWESETDEPSRYQQDSVDPTTPDDLDQLRAESPTKSQLLEELHQLQGILEATLDALEKVTRESKYVSEQLEMCKRDQEADREVEQIAVMGLSEELEAVRAERDSLTRRLGKEVRKAEEVRDEMKVMEGQVKKKEGSITSLRESIKRISIKHTSQMAVKDKELKEAAAVARMRQTEACTASERSKKLTMEVEERDKRVNHLTQTLMETKATNEKLISLKEIRIKLETQVNTQKALLDRAKAENTRVKAGLDETNRRRHQGNQIKDVIKLQMEKGCYGNWTEKLMSNGRTGCDDITTP